jgi:L-threonylcarbamoyladenylate synthase
MVIVEGELSAVIRKIVELAKRYSMEGEKVGILATDGSIYEYGIGLVKSMGSRGSLKSIAKNLFRRLRDFDGEEVDIIIAEDIPQEGLGLAIMNRLRKAAGYSIVKTE